MGISFVESGDSVIIKSPGIENFKEIEEEIDCGNSGTTVRLLLGILSGLQIQAKLIGDSSLSKRPMKRVTKPLETMGAKFFLKEGNYLPIEVSGKNSLIGKTHKLEVASAQLKSALLFAGIFAQGETILTGRIDSRDHTERLLPYYGGQIKKSSGELSITGGQKVSPVDYKIPRDISSAAFWITLCLLHENSWVKFEDVLLNPTRMGFINVIKKNGVRKLR